MNSQRGFTLTELVIVLIITGVLAAVAVPRLFNQDQFAARASHDFVVSSLRYAQKSAIAMRRPICVLATGTNLTITIGTAPTLGSCVTDLMNPANGLRYADAGNALPGSVTMAGSTQFAFDTAGRPLASGGAHAPLASAVAITVNGYAQPVTVEPESGLVR